MGCPHGSVLPLQTPPPPPALHLTLDTHTHWLPLEVQEGKVQRVSTLVLLDFKHRAITYFGFRKPLHYNLLQTSLLSARKKMNFVTYANFYNFL